MSRVFVVVSEARADFMLATELADRVFVEAIHWLDEVYLDSERKWVGKEPDGLPLTWGSIPKQAEKLGMKLPHGHFDNDSAKREANSARRAINYSRKLFPQADAILLIRDQDNQPKCRDGLQQARDSSHQITIVIGVAVIERESWVLSGFDTEADAESLKLLGEMEKLAFHPCDYAHRLTANKDHEIRSPKRVLKVLTDDNWERQRRCWVETPLASLKNRGQDNGLAEYLKEVHARLVPLIDTVHKS